MIASRFPQRERVKNIIVLSAGGFLSFLRLSREFVRIVISVRGYGFKSTQLSLFHHLCQGSLRGETAIANLFATE
jgi:hypothetical protein